MKKVKEWLLNKNNAQFVPLLKAENGAIRLVNRICDEHKFMYEFHYASLGGQHFIVNDHQLKHDGFHASRTG